jgi:hypothetical protein
MGWAAVGLVGEEWLWGWRGEEKASERTSSVCFSLALSLELTSPTNTDSIQRKGTRLSLSISSQYVFPAGRADGDA